LFVCGLFAADDGFLAFDFCLVLIFEFLIENLYQFRINTTGYSFNSNFVVISLFTPLAKSNSAKSKVFSNISIYELAKNKLFVFQPDKKKH
jgi:hypothetical protein